MGNQASSAGKNSSLASSESASASASVSTSAAKANASINSVLKNANSSNLNMNKIKSGLELILASTNDIYVKNFQGALQPFYQIVSKVALMEMNKDETKINASMEISELEKIKSRVDGLKSMLNDSYRNVSSKMMAIQNKEIFDKINREYTEKLSMLKKRKEKYLIRYGNELYIIIRDKKAAAGQASINAKMAGFENRLASLKKSGGSRKRRISRKARRSHKRRARRVAA
jgi:hypothetical protein